MCDSVGNAQTVSVIVGAEDRARLAAILGDRNRPRHVQRVNIIVLSAERLPVQSILAGQLLNEPAHGVSPVGDLAQKAHLARAPGLGQRDGDRLFVRVHGDKHPAILLHGSSPVSKAKRRPTRRNPRSQHNVRRNTFSSAGTWGLGSVLKP
ncbi:hypothetical protein CHT98_20005 (plasmid) [Azospirillum brasilense]|uniref:Uncharacterized protein n=1 Tax=Azospirillum brasilense TaxID=192 RepID=A0A235H9Q2_AZOBR|nr:hypothetical protein CHT98_20005 [Azospirillum brasilense]